MQISDNTIDRKKQLWDDIYRWTVILAILAALILISVGVHQVFVISNRIDQRNAQTQQSLGCIAKFFATPQRATLTVSDLDQCTLVRK